MSRMKRRFGVFCPGREMIAIPESKKTRPVDINNNIHLPAEPDDKCKNDRIRSQTNITKNDQYFTQCCGNINKDSLQQESTHRKCNDLKKSAPQYPMKVKPHFKTIIENSMQESPKFESKYNSTIETSLKSIARKGQSSQIVKQCRQFSAAMNSNRMQKILKVDEKGSFEQRVVAQSIPNDPITILQSDNLIKIESTTEEIQLKDILNEKRVSVLPTVEPDHKCKSDENTFGKNTKTDNYSTRRYATTLNKNSTQQDSFYRFKKPFYKTIVKKTLQCSMNEKPCFETGIQNPMQKSPVVEGHQKSSNIISFIPTTRRQSLCNLKEHKFCKVKKSNIMPRVPRVPKVNEEDTFSERVVVQSIRHDPSSTILQSGTLMEIENNTREMQLNVFNERREYVIPTLLDIVMDSSPRKHEGIEIKVFLKILYADKYKRAKNELEKALIVYKIFDHIKETGGKFLKESSAMESVFYEVDDWYSMKKMRELLNQKL